MRAELKGAHLGEEESEDIVVVCGMVCVRCCCCCYFGKHLPEGYIADVDGDVISHDATFIFDLGDWSRSDRGKVERA